MRPTMENIDTQDICLKDNLRTEYFTFVENLDLPVLLEFMKAHGGMTRRQIDNIMSAASPHDRVMSFLESLEDASKDGRQVFIEGLKQTNQSHLAGLVTGKRI